MGSYNGKFTYEAFTHRKSVLTRKFWLSDPPLRYPPYTPDKIRALERLKILGKYFPWWKHFLFSLVLVIVSVWYLK